MGEEAIRGRALVARRPNPVFSDEYEVVRAVIADARRRRGLSQRRLAQLLGKCLSHVSLIERGQRRVDCLEWIRLGELLCDDPGALFAETRRRLRALQGAEAGGNEQLASQRPTPG